MTAARRALPAPFTPLQRLRALLFHSLFPLVELDARHDRLVSALEDQADRLDARSRELGGERNLRGLDHAKAADDLRRLIEEHA